MGFGAPELLVLVFPLILLGIGFAIWVLIDVRRYPVDAYARAGVNRTAWVAAPIVAIVACLAFNVVGTCATLIMSLIWRTVIRPQVATA